MPSETGPNCLFAHAGTSFGALKFDKLVRQERTIFDLLHDASLDSGVYAGDIAQVLTFGWDVAGRVRHMSHFEHDVRKGDLPEYTFIEPRHFDSPLGKANSQHPTSKFHGIMSTGFVPRGETLIAQVYTALCANPDIWEHTLLILLYDEHGGFYDRFRPPEVTPTGKVAKNGFPFDLLGPRIPVIVISPYVRPGLVEHSKVFDHTSLTATIRELFELPGAPLSEREGAAETVTSLLDLSTARSWDDVPSLEDYTKDDWWRDLELEEAVDRPLDDFQRQLLELARALDSTAEVELAVTDESTSQAVADQVASFVERNYPPAAEAQAPA